MKLIISRKGFDSSFGGCPSPILPDGALVSLPIPGGTGSTRYGDIERGGMSLGAISQALGGAPAPRHVAHLDPDLRLADLPRTQGWRGSLGQTGAARSHLRTQGVEAGDLFLFFGWFRQTALTDGKLALARASKDIHCCFGYLQVGEIVELGALPDTERHLAERPWLAGHPHLDGRRDENNALYIGSQTLSLPGLDKKLPGWGSFESFAPELALSDPAGSSRSDWILPDCFGPGSVGLSYHGAPERWGQSADGARRLRAVAKGQEFVADVGQNAQALAWIASIVERGMRPAIAPTDSARADAPAKLAARRAEKNKPQAPAPAPRHNAP